MKLIIKNNNINNNDKQNNYTVISPTFNNTAISNSPSPSHYNQLSAKKPGSYAVTTIQSMPWLMTPTQKKETKTRRKTAKIVNPNFVEYIDYVSDPFWKEIFENASKGKFPKGFFYKDGVLSYRKKNTPVLQIPADKYNATLLCLDYFRNIGDMKSAIDLEAELETRSSLENVSVIWMDAKHKTINPSLIRQYVTMKHEELGLNSKTATQFRTVINMGFFLGCLDSSSVVFKDSKIDDIKGVIYDKENNKFILDPSILNKIKIPKTKNITLEADYLNPQKKVGDKYIDSINLKSIWLNYVENLSKTSSNSDSTKFSTRLTPSTPSTPSTPLTTLNNLPYTPCNDNNDNNNDNDSDDASINECNDETLDFDD
jgi:hypothetical protein